ncbi:aldehyde dehydrogenase family protein [Solidesulfovibrio sp.]|uniref:aldehyde dehydrogenase family protein n=1 Tax=Solidesulfovibrio sp. TaxID=2910990 RepID=UPI002B21CF04|nr:aldehyde dehydrogenase family protein [Solidesulfovibrio sp.]MEA4858527.1 aldehyde dehydrogenase family protein [Solidesulfovibrio sp.]
MFASINPATGQFLARYSAHDAPAARRILDGCAAAYGLWRDVPLDERLTVLTRLADRLEARLDDLAGLASREMGKLLAESRAEVRRCARACRFYAKMAPRWLAPETIACETGRRLVVYEPLGVILAVMPWNFPYWQVLRAAIPLLAAGNAVAVKHAHNVTGASLALEALFAEAGLPDGVLGLLRIDNALVAEAIGHPAVRGVTLTGSARAGAAVGALAGAAVKKTVMELGGSDPFIVLADAALDDCCAAAETARMRVCGQACIAAKRFLVEAPLYPVFAERLAERLAAHRPGDPFDPATTVGPLAREDLLANLDRQVRESVAMGAKLALGGHRLPGPGFYYAPTLLTEVRPGMPAFEEELFGPVAAVVEAADADAAVALANASPYGLGASVGTADTARGLRLARRIEAGMVAVNAVPRSDFRLPFGGVKGSGHGRELARYGLTEFCNIKSLIVEDA